MSFFRNFQFWLVPLLGKCLLLDLGSLQIGERIPVCRTTVSGLRDRAPKVANRTDTEVTGESRRRPLKGSKRVVNTSWMILSPSYDPGHLSFYFSVSETGRFRKKRLDMGTIGVQRCGI